MSYYFDNFVKPCLMDRYKVKEVNPLLQFLIAGYRLDGNANDIRGLNNGVGSNVNYLFDSDKNKVVADFTGSGGINTGISRFDGVGLFADSNEQWSVSFWAKNNISSDGTLFSYISRAVVNIALRTFFIFSQNQQYRLQIRPLFTTLFIAADEIVNEWYHTIITWDGSVSKTYINGEFLINNDVGTQAEVSDAIKIYIGSRNGGNPLNGKMSDVFIFKKALNQQEINLAMQGL